MNSLDKEIAVNSFNCRGLSDSNKRNTIFNWLRSRHNGITMLQETHSVQSDENKWASEWGGDVFFSHGSRQSKGVAILIPPKMGTKLQVSNVLTDNEGRILILNSMIDENSMLSVNVYAPTKDHIEQQLLFLTKLRGYLEQFSEKQMIIGGDFNTYLDIKVDKKGGKPERSSRYTDNLLSLMEEFGLKDIWRQRNPEDLKFTRREHTKAGIVQSRLDYFLVSGIVTYNILDTSIKQHHPNMSECS